MPLLLKLTLVPHLIAAVTLAAALGANLTLPAAPLWTTTRRLSTMRHGRPR
jgi:hypothetical protein